MKYSRYHTMVERADKFKNGYTPKNRGARVLIKCLYCSSFYAQQHYIMLQRVPYMPRQFRPSCHTRALCQNS